MSFSATEWHLQPTGIVEYTDLSDIDTGLQNYFGRILGAMVVTDTSRKQNREFVDFQKRPLKEKLYVGQFDSPEEFIQKLAKSTQSQAQTAKLLPACYISRGMDVTYCDGDDYPDLTYHGELHRPGGQEPYAIVSKSFVKLTYTLTTLTWNKETCSRIALGLSMWTRHMKSDRGRSFQIKSMIAGAPVRPTVELNQPRLAVGTSIPVSFSESRLYGVSFDFEVIAEVYEAQHSDLSATTFIYDEPEPTL